MTELTYPTMPEAPAVPPVVEKWHELRREFHGQDRIDLLPSLPFADQSKTPSVRLLGDLDSFERYGFGRPEYEFAATNADRANRFVELAEKAIGEIYLRMQLAHELAEHTEANRAELEAYESAREAWRKECERLKDEYYEAKAEASRERDRARYEVGRLVRPFRAHNYWEIIARNGKGAIIRERRHDDKPARIRELADVLEVA